MNNSKIPIIPIITGSVALIAIIVVLIITGNSGDKGLYISETTDGVSIVSSDGTTIAASPGTKLSQGDSLSTIEGAYCAITYKGKKNSENNYIIVNSNSEIVVSDKFTGKSSGQIMLSNGSLLCNFSEDSKGTINIRTADTMIYTENSVVKVGYTTDGFSAYTDVYSFMGKDKIQLYDSQGNPVNDPELLIEKRAGRVTTNELGPEFSYLNIDFPLSDLTGADLKNLITISNFVEKFPYSTEELQTAFDAAPSEEILPLEEDNSNSGVQSETSDNSEIIQSAEPIETNTETSLDIKPPEETSATTTASSADTTTSSETTASETTTVNKNQVFTVTIIIDDEESVQEVKYGESADKPSDPLVDGKKFIGWDNSFDNITDDRVITAIFDDSSSNDIYHTVTIVIANKSTTIQVKDGQAASIPETISIDGYIFEGWDTDYSNVKSDITVTAILKPAQSSCTVTFVINGMSYPTTVEYGGTAYPPNINLGTDAYGNAFTKWDKSLTNITSDTTITAIYGQEYYIVTFVIDGKSYPVKVKNGSDAVPPFTPTVNSKNQSFIGWDGNYLCVKSDLTINAIFA